MSDVLAEALWAVEWLVSLIDDGRITDLDDDDAYVDRVDRVRMRLERLVKASEESR